MATGLELIDFTNQAQRLACVGLGFQAQVTRTTNLTFTTEAVVMTVPSITYFNGRAYRVTVWGLHSAPSDNYALYRIRKGNTTAGTIYKDQLRINNLQASTSNAVVNFSTILTNISGASITTQISLTGGQGGVAQTWTWIADANNVSYVSVEDIGSTANWTGQPIS